MSEHAASQPPHPTAPVTIADLLRDAEPMGDLSRFAIDDLTPEEADELFRILEDA